MKQYKLLILTFCISTNLIFSQDVILVLDSTFANNGKVITDLGSTNDKEFDIAIQPDGKIVGVGQYFSNNYDFAVVRYNTEGSLDADFGDGGKVTSPVGPHFDHGKSIAVQPDGKIVAAGYSWNGLNEDFSVVRYNVDGTLDNTFSDNGKVLSDFNSSKDQGLDIAIQSDGKIVVIGYVDRGGGDEDFALIRYNSNGSLDNTFGSDSRVTTDFNSSKDKGECIAIQSDGKIIVAGNSNGTNGSNFAVARYNNDGSLDNTFNGNGKILTDLGSTQDKINDIAIQSDRKIIVVGVSNDALAAVRYNNDGSLDAGFGENGIITTSAFSSLSSANSVVIQDDGKIVFAGYKRNSENNNSIAIARYKSNGILDTEFNNGGIATADFESAHAIGESIVIQNDGKFVVGGYVQSGGNYDFTVVRFTTKIAEPPSFTPAPFDSLVYYKFNKSDILKKHKITSEDYIHYELNEIWDDASNAWLNYSQTTVTFDANNNRIQNLGQLWDTNKWVNWWKSDFTYNENNEKQSWQYYTWISFWSPGVKETYTHDANGNIILKEAVTDFKNVWRDSLIYDSNNNLATYIAEDWVDNQWVNDWRESYFYGVNGKLSETVKEDWQNNQWTNDYRKLFTYNTNDNLTEMLFESWSNSNQWEASEQASYTYNDNQNIVYAKYEKMKNSNWVLANGELKFNNDLFKKGVRVTATAAELIVHYDGVTAIEDNKPAAENFTLNQNYPNPFNPSTKIKYQIPNSGHVTLKIYNILGKEITTLVNKEQIVGNYEINFNALALSSGIYFYQLHSGSNIIVKKMMLLK